MLNTCSISWRVAARRRSVAFITSSPISWRRAVSPLCTLSDSSPEPMNLHIYMGKISEYLHEGDTTKSHQAYLELKSLVRNNPQEQLGALDDAEWYSLKKELFRACIAQTQYFRLGTAYRLEATLQAHNILEDLDDRLGLYALPATRREEEDGQGRLVVNLLDDVQPVENSEIFDYALEVLQAWARASHSMRADDEAKNLPLHVQRLARGMPQRAQLLLDQLKRLSSKELPIAYYESVLKTWACSTEHLRGVQAEKIFQRIPANSITPEAMHWITRAWAWSRDPRAAFTATGHLMKRLRYHSKEMGTRMEPSLEDYEVVFKAWTRAEDRMAPTKAFSLWTLWQQSIEDGVTTVKPSLNVYRSLLLTATARPNQPDLGRKVVDVLLKRMKDDLIIPDTSCYESAICVWKNCAVHPDVPEERQACVRRIISLLGDLRNAQQRGGANNSTIGVTTKVLNHVLESLRVSEHSQRTTIADGILKEMEERLVHGQSRSAPTPDSYRFALNVYETLTTRDRIPLAKIILWRCKDHLLKGEVTAEIRKQSTEVLNSFILICATTPQPVASEEGVLILREALYAVERFRSDCSVVPNENTYTYLLQAVKELLKSPIHRAKIVDRIFLMACQDGMVNDVLLKIFIEVTTPEQYHRLVIAFSEEVEGIKVIPASWSRNVLGGRVVSSDGRKVKPVSIDGRLTETKAMQEFKMRRLRDKRNQKLLQGGRWDRSLDAVEE